MNKATKRVSKFCIFSFILLCITAVSTTNILALVDFNKPVTIKSGMDEAFTHTVKRFSNQKFKIGIRYDETVNPLYRLHIICSDVTTWSMLRNGSITFNNLTISAGVYLFYEELGFEDVPFTISTVIPDWEDWTFAFVNLNSGEMKIIIKLEYRHVLWWLWVVLPLFTVLGLGGYGVLENITKYERTRIDISKAFRKIVSKNENDRKRASYWLASNGSEAELDALRELLDHKNPSVREDIAYVIGKISERTNNRSQSQILIQKYEAEQDFLVKEEIVGALSDINDPTALPILDEYLQHPRNEKLRYKIALSLGKLGSEKAAKPLIKTLNGNNTDTLKIACRKALEEIALKTKIDLNVLIEKHSN